MGSFNRGDSENYDVVVLGGGYGTRLSGPYNPKKYLPKGLTTIGERPCIERTLEAFSAKFFNRIIVETNNEGSKHYLRWAQSYTKRKKIEICLEPLSKPTDCLGVLETICYVWKNYRFSKPVLILAPDNLFLEKQDQLFEDTLNSPLRILTYEVDSLEEARKYGVVELRGNRVISCTEKPNNPISKTIRTSAEIWSPSVFEHLHKWIKTGNTDRVGEFIKYLIEKGILIASCSTKGVWIDIGTQKDIDRAREILK